MNKLRCYSMLFLCMVTLTTQAQSKVVPVNYFEKVIVSPHIQVNFVEGDTESVTIVSNEVSNDKLHIETKGDVLRLYLDGAKTTTKSKKIEREGRSYKQALYTGTIVTAIVTYTHLAALSLRGEEVFTCEHTLKGETFKLTVYGESEVYLKRVDLDFLHTTIYGESYLEIQSGTVGKQKIKAYGEVKINMLGLKNRDTRITAFGEGKYRLNVEDNLKITALGESLIHYTGNPDVNKGITLGEVKIIQMQ